MEGYFGIGVEHIKYETNIGTLFRSAYTYGASFIFTVGRRYKRQASDTTKMYLHRPLYYFETLDDLRKHLPHNCPLIGIEMEKEAIMLNEFKHTNRACYLLGAEDHGLTNEALNTCHYLIQIPGEPCLNVSVAGSIVMYDRYIKMINEISNRYIS